MPNSRRHGRTVSPDNAHVKDRPRGRSSEVSGKTAVETKARSSQRKTHHGGVGVTRDGGAGAARDRGARTNTARRSASARPGRTTKPRVRSDMGDQRAGDIRVAQGKVAGRKPDPARRPTADPPRNAGPKARHRERSRRTLRARLVGISPRTVILLILLMIFIVLAISPVTRNLEAAGRLREMNDQLKKEKAVTESLEKEVSEARSIDYVEREARRQRMVAPGEILYLVTANGSESEVKYRVKALQSMEEAWERVRQLLHSVSK